MEPKKTSPESPEAGKETGKENESPENGKDQEAIKGLQRVVSEKDKKIKELEEMVQKNTTPPTEIEALKNQIADLTETVKKGHQELQAKELQSKYPDIPPYILVGRSEEEQIKIVADVRARAQTVYGDSDFFVKKAVLSIDEIDVEIEKLKTDHSIDLDTKLFRVRELERQKIGLKT